MFLRYPVTLGEDPFPPSLISNTSSKTHGVFVFPSSFFKYGSRVLVHEGGEVISLE